MRWALLLAALAAPLTAMAQSVVPTRPLRSHTVIAPTDVATVAGRVPGGAASLEDVIGLETRVALYPGQPIKLGEIGPAAVITRNDVVTMIYSAGGLTIITDGRALDRAAVGDRVRVMNLDSRMTVTGRVREDGAVEVGR